MRARNCQKRAGKSRTFPARPARCVWISRRACGIVTPAVSDPVEHLYIHIPFCAAKCDYCAFYSEPAEAAKIERFLAALERELERAAPRLAPRTVFIGGGTPSILTTAQFERLLTRLESQISNLKSQITEWTVEMNPATVSPEKARLLRASGVNRISMGVQALDDALLERLGRVHTVAMAHKSLDVLREAGFTNINLDFIFAIPGQTLAQWDETLRRAVALAPQHLSTYELTYEDDTPLLRDLQEGRVALADEAPALAMYQRMQSAAAEAGFRQYEISNFARPGLECRHNLNYWRGGDYIGLGPSACGYADGRRYKNVANTEVYCERIERGKSPVDYDERLTPRARAGELVAFALRMNEGITATAFQAHTGFRLDQLWPDELRTLVEQEMVEWDGLRLRLTPRGRLLADSVAERFIVLEKAEVRSHHRAEAERPTKTI
ncbi:MAG: radical SAM family heme chaperone HemW [Verrucomicrobia bacterium]|nr:radical SAM family heme chaperone HemW [Verrucomicrobiota bacterium]